MPRQQWSVTGRREGLREFSASAGRFIELCLTDSGHRGPISVNPHTWKSSVALAGSGRYQ